MSDTHTRRPDSPIGKLLGWSIAVLGSLVVAYFAWRRLPLPMWHWANEAWWHWIFAPFAFFLLFAAPIFTLVGASPMLAVARSGAGRDLGWEAVSFLGALAAGVLVLWSFTPAPQWWTRSYWWIWGLAVVVSAAVSAAGRMFRTVHEVGSPKARSSFAEEWKFNHGDASSPPRLGMAMSGGGIRSAAFNLGVLQALHDAQILRDVEVMSAVSGGSYAMSWYLLQPFYASQEAARDGKSFQVFDTLNEMFRPDGALQKHIVRDPRVVEWEDLGISVVMDATFGQLLRAMSSASGFVGQFNGTAVRREYRERLQRLFQGRPSPTSEYAIANEIDWNTRQELDLDASDFSCVTPVNYRELAEFLQRNRLPFFVFNGAVLVHRSYRHLLWPTAFEWTATDIGSDVCGYRSWEELREWEVTETRPKGMSLWKWTRLLGTMDRGLRRYRWVLMANLAPAISGAAIGLSYFDPKKRSRERKLATWTPFFGNLDLGYLLPRQIWNGKGTLYVSDGGHCENLGAYALIKRQCRKIIIVDAEHEKSIPYVFAAYSKLKERLAQELGLLFTVADIDAYLEAAKGVDKPTGPTAAVMIGDVRSKASAPSVGPMSVVYIKLGLDRTRLDSYPAQVSEYAKTHPLFPQDPTSDQAFTSEQFIAYRDLGRHVASNLPKLIRKTGDTH